MKCVLTSSSSSILVCVSCLSSAVFLAGPLMRRWTQAFFPRFPDVWQLWIFFNSAGLIERIIRFCFSIFNYPYCHTTWDAIRSASFPLTSGLGFSPNTYPHVSFFEEGLCLNAPSVVIISWERSDVREINNTRHCFHSACIHNMQAGHRFIF